MKKDLSDRVKNQAEYIASTHNTIRKTAQTFGLSKSTVHNDMSKKLPKIDAVLYEKVSIILKENFEEKHIRGGCATKEKYKREKEIECYN